MDSPKGDKVAVVGSANLDIVVAVKRFPAPGETVLGGTLLETSGGKGLNQAVAAARVTYRKPTKTTRSGASRRCTGRG